MSKLWGGRFAKEANDLLRQFNDSIGFDQRFWSEDIEGSIAECGGACSCATCHVYGDEAWLARLPAPDALEDGMLDCVLDRQANSRLSCQIRVTEDLDGITVRVPDSQI